MDYRISARREVFGELDRRMEANHARLLTREYSVEYMREMDKSDWPGDYRGRTLLALACQYEMLRRDSDNLSEIIEDTLNVLSDKGYLGAEVRHGATDEQQLAGHSWFLRALIAAERITGDARVRAALERMFERLFLASSAAFEEYPIKREAAIEAGGPIGTVQGDVQDGWRLSSDVGCVFIALDGLSDYYACTRDARAKAAFDALLERFIKLDPVKLRLQTHATLSALRGVMRMYAVTSERSLIALVEERYRLYLDRAITLNYANYNWFERPEWTECCAVVDSYMLAVELFKQGRGEGYVEIANRILYNALFAGQRNNGGFGSDCCLASDGSVRVLKAHPDCYEAYWCCTMRGAEGLSYAASNIALEKGGAIYLLNWNSGKFAFDGATLEVHTEFPISNAARLRVSGAEGDVRVMLYRPENCALKVDGQRFDSGNFAQITLKNGAECVVEIEARAHSQEVGGGKILWRGPFIYDAAGMRLADRFYLTREMLEKGSAVID